MATVRLLSEQLTFHEDGNMSKLPSAYQVVHLSERPKRWYPLRFGKFRLDSRGYRISFSRREDAEAFCHNEQADYVRAYPSVADAR